MAPTYNSAKEDIPVGTRTARNRNHSRNGKMMNQRGEELSLTVTSQVWQKSGKCPEATIPVRRIRKRELLKAHSVEDYGRKKPSFSHHQNGQVNKNLDSFVQLKNHSVSFVTLIALLNTTKVLYQLKNSIFCLFFCLLYSHS